jgi:hypothetical protein
MISFSKGRFWVVVILLLSIGAMVSIFLDGRAPRVGVVLLPLPTPETLDLFARIRISICRDVAGRVSEGGHGINGIVVKRHGGTVSFETEVGRGTAFIVRLPLG